MDKSKGEMKLSDDFLDQVSGRVDLSEIMDTLFGDRESNHPPMPMLGQPVLPTTGCRIFQSCWGSRVRISSNGCRYVHSSKTFCSSALRRRRRITRERFFVRKRHSFFNWCFTYQLFIPKHYGAVSLLIETGSFGIFRGGRITVIEEPAGIPRGGRVNVRV